MYLTSEMDLIGTWIMQTQGLYVTMIFKRLKWAQVK